MIMLGVVGLVAMTAVAGVSADLLLHSRVAAMRTIPDPFADLPSSQRPSPRPEGGVTILLAGVDSGMDVSSTGAGRDADTGRSDALMLVRVTADRRRAFVISLPRDSWVDIPGRGKDKINAAFAYGGPTLAVRTVEQLSGVRIDHVAVVDMAGFKQLIDALGGINIDVPVAFTDPQGVFFSAGTRRFNGETALRYVRQRYGLPRGDLDRVQRQQEFLKATFEQIGQEGNPLQLAAAFDAITKTVSVDAGFGIGEMTQLLLHFRQIRGSVTFLTVPVQGTGQVGDASVVFLDATLAPAFWTAVATDNLEAYLSTHDTDRLGGPPR